MITQILTEEAEAAAQRYNLLVEGWRALYAQALDQNNFGSASQFRIISEQAYQLATMFLDGEDQRIQQAAEAVASEAQRATVAQIDDSGQSDSTGAVRQHVDATVQFIARELRIQIERDIAFLMQSLRKAVLSVTLAARATRTPIKAALINYRIGNATELHFFVRDRGAQRWPSRKFVRALWRMNLLAIYNETVLATLADHGIETAVIKHVDPNSNDHGMEVSIAPNSSLPTYAELRDTLFHPNSDAVLSRSL